MLSGVFFGLCSLLLIETLKWGEKLAARFRIWYPLKGLIGGAFLVLLTFACSTQYLGLGLDTIEGALKGEQVPWYSFLLKIVFTSTTLNFGGSGGIVTPIFFVGASSGAFFGDLMHLDMPTFAAIGFTSLLAGAANTPIAASIMSVEMFGPAIAPYAAVACIVSFLMTGHRSVYPSQVLSMVKSSSLQAEVGKEMERIRTVFTPREKSVTGFADKVIRRIKNKRVGLQKKP